MKLEDGVTEFLRDVAAGREDTVLRRLRLFPALGDLAGPHPYWGGRPTAVTLAAEWGRTSILRALLDSGAHPDAPAARYDGWTPLLCAIERRHDDAIGVLRNAGARIDIWAAAALGDAGRVDFLVSEEPSLVKARGPNRATALHFAATAAVARMLVENGADNALLDKYGSTPLRCTAYTGSRRRDAARYLAGLEKNIDFFTLVALGDVAAVTKRLDADAALLDERDGSMGPATSRGSTPLHIAAALGDADMVRLLLDRGADANVAIEHGETPLHHAARGGSIDAVRALIAHGASPDVRDASHDSTPEAWARFFEQDQVAAYLESLRYAP